MSCVCLLLLLLLRTVAKIARVYSINHLATATATKEIRGKGLVFVCCFFVALVFEFFFASHQVQ